MGKIAIIGTGIASLFVAAYIGGTTISCNSKAAKQTTVIEETLEPKFQLANFDSSCYELRGQDSLQIITLTEQLTEVVVQLNAAAYENDGLRKQVTNLKARNDSIHESAFLARYKLERVRYYLNICLRNPSQDKFLKGWIARALQ